MIVPFFRWKLVISILFRCDIILSFSAYSFIESPISFLLTIAFLKFGGNLAKFASDIQDF